MKLPSLFSIAAGVLFALCLSSCSKDDDTTTTSTPTISRRTVLIYMAAQNSLGNARASVADSAEIAYGSNFLKSTEDNILLFIDDASAPRLYRFYKSTNGKAYIQTVKQYASDLNSAEPSTLRDVLKLVAQQYPSKSYGLVLWSHGSSWLPPVGNNQVTTTSSVSTNEGFHTLAFGLDVGPGGSMTNDTSSDGKLGTQMDIDQMASAISESGVHPDFIFFDACIMQGIEVAYSLRNVTNYIIGSPSTTSAYGACYYDQISKGLFAYPASDDSIKKIAATYYYDAVDNEDLKQYYQNQGCAISVIKTAGLDNLASLTAQCIGKAITGKQSPDMSGVLSYVPFRYTGYPDSYDLTESMKHLLASKDSTMWKQWKAAADQCVIYHKTSDYFYYYSSGTHEYLMPTLKHSDICCVSMFIPQTEYTTYQIYGDLNKWFTATKWYAAAGWSQTGW